MSMQADQFHRLDSGSTVDTKRLVNFTYDGVRYSGVEGDTLASALLANGVRLVGRSFKYHRPRGIFAAGPEEPNALVQLEEGAYTEPNTRATVIELYEGLSASSQNCWPSVNYDIGALNSLVSRALPAGFYYKTFMWPASMWMTYEKFIRKAAGLGESPVESDPDNYEQYHAHCDVLIAGAGPAGLAAALSAGQAGARVILMDEHSHLGGSLLWNRSTIDGQNSTEWVAATLKRLEQMENVRVVNRCTVAGYYDYNFVTALERITDHWSLEKRQQSSSPRQRFWQIRAKQVVLATGSIERPLLFADNDRPGVMLASAIRVYSNRYGVLPSKKMVFFVNNDSAYAGAIEASVAGAAVSIVDLRAESDIDVASLSAVRKLSGKQAIALHTNCGIAQVMGKKGITGIKIKSLSSDGKSLTGSATDIECDIIGVSGGWNPTVHLFSQSRGKVEFEPSIQSFIPNNTAGGGTATNSNFSAGACAGVFDLEQCLLKGGEAGAAAALKAGLKPGKAETIAAQPALAEGVARFEKILWTVPTDHPVGQGPRKHFHDMQNDVTVADIHLAAREGYVSVEHLKRYTTTGMGTDQGKTSNIAALAIMAEIRGAQIPDVGTTTFRPPYTPVTFGAITGQYCGELFLQKRTTAMHKWHELNGAVFEDVGDWKRPWYFPREGEDMHAAVQRESKAVRQSVGMVDASTLGKIDIQGPDAAEFLNMIYTNAWLKLGVGRCRYGLMLNEHGMVFDDGVTSRIGENHFHMTTTTGGAARVMGWLEEWLQTEWPDKQVYCTSVTEQWAVVALNGPNAAKLLAKLTDIDLSNEAFPHMSCQEGKVAGIDARVFRISFTGERSYEINVPARYGLSLWEALVSAGEEFDICVYGTETMHVLRAEKGFVIVGQDTDGTVTPHDLDMSWNVNEKKPDFLGKRSLARSHTASGGRRQLVGLLTEDPAVVLPEGVHLVDVVEDKPPMDTVGHVTSSYMSPNLERSIAMALVTNGLTRKGDTVKAVLMDGQVVQAKIVDPVFIDPEGVLLHG